MLRMLSARPPERVNSQSRTSIGERKASWSRPLRHPLRPKGSVAGKATGGASGAAGGGGSSRRRVNINLDSARKTYGPQTPPGGSSPPTPAGPSGPGEQPLFPPQPDRPADPDISAAISAASSWRQLKDLYGSSARRMHPLQLLHLTQRLGHLTGALVWPEGAPLPETLPRGLEPPPLSERDVQDVVALAATVCRETQLCLTEGYGLQQVAGLLQALVSLGVAPPPSWLRDAELVAIRTQLQGQGKEASSTLLNELLLLAASFQRLSYTPDRSFVQLLAEVRPVEEVPPPQGQDTPLLMVLTAPQLLVLARAVLLWGLQPREEWVRDYIQAIYTRISRANDLLSASRPSAGGEDVEAAEAEAALRVGGLASLLWAVIMLEARPTDPEGLWMGQFCRLAMRRLAQVADGPAVVLAAEAGAGEAEAGELEEAEEAVGDAAVALQDIAGLLSAVYQLMFDPGEDFVNTCLRAASLLQARTDPATVAARAAATAAVGTPPVGDSLAASLFFAAAYDHPQDEQTRGSVIAAAQTAQDWMDRQATEAAAAAADSGRLGVAAPLTFTGRGLTQLLLALVRMGGRPSEEWLESWVGAAAPLTGGAGAIAAPPGAGFTLDQIEALLGTCGTEGLPLPPQLQESLLGGIIRSTALTPATAPSSPSSSSSSAAAAAAAAGPGPFMPAGVTMGGSSTTSSSPGSGSGSGSGRVSGVRSLAQFRTLLDVMDMAGVTAEAAGGPRGGSLGGGAGAGVLAGELVELFVELVEDFRLKLSARELLVVLRALSNFRNTVVLDGSRLPQSPTARRQQVAAALEGPATAGPRGSASRQPIVTPIPPGTLAHDYATAAADFGSDASADASDSGSTRSSAAGLGPGSAGFVSKAAARAGGGEAGVALSPAWVRGLLEDLRVRGGVREAGELVALTQALLALRVPASLMSYVENFAVSLTGEDGQRKAPSPAGPAARAVAGAAAAAGAAGEGGQAAGGSGAAAPSASSSRIRLRLQQQRQQAAGASAAAAGASAAAGDRGGSEAGRGPEGAEEAAGWALAWPAMLAAFAELGHLPDQRWWTRFAEATSAALQSYEPVQQAAMAAAALGLSTRYSLEAESRGAVLGPGESLLPSEAWLAKVLGPVADAITSCPFNLADVREQMLLNMYEAMRAEQHQQQGGQEPQATATTSTPTDLDDVDLSALTSYYSQEDFNAAYEAAAARLPSLLSALTDPRVPLPADLLQVLEGVAGASAERTEQRLAEQLEDEEGEGEGEGDAGGLDLDAVVYAQQVVTLVAQAFLSSDLPPSSDWWPRVGPIMVVTQPEWEQAPGSGSGELHELPSLVLTSDQLTTFAYLAGKCDVPLEGPQVLLMLQHAVRLVRRGEMTAGQLAGLLAGLAGAAGEEVVAAGEAEVGAVMQFLAEQAGRLAPRGLAEVAAAVVQMAVQLPEDLALSFRPAVVRCLGALEPAQMLAVVAAGGSLGLQPPSRELLGALSMQVGRLASHPDSLGPPAATDVAYEVLRWFPEVDPRESSTYVTRLASGLQPVLRRLDQVPEPFAAKLALLLATAAVEPPGRSDQERQTALQPLVDSTAAGLSEYDTEQLSNALMGLSLLGIKLPRTWMEQFKEVSRRHLADADSRSLSYFMAGFADQDAVLDAPYMSAFWSAVQRCAAPSLRSFDLLSGKVLLESCGKLGLRPDRDLMQAVLDCTVIRYREAPDPSGLVQLVQVLSAAAFVPSPGWALEVRSLLGPAMPDLPPDVQHRVAAFLRGPLPQGARSRG